MKWILILIAAASAFAAGFFINGKPASGASQAAADKVAPGVVTGSLVAAAGRVEPVSEEIRMGAEVNGKLREVLVDEGDRIRRGQVLAIIENADYSARVASSEAVLQSRDAAVRKLENGSRPEER
ncbi:MAG: biotin/lipoyl-binding protein, partial [Bryobacteraceae bacterium]|nr:biotin/lipoyl-binding protein [Bryobacteraceae bacterium]